MSEQFYTDRDYHDSLFDELANGVVRIKPEVHFHMLNSPIVVGERARVKTIDHPSYECNSAPFTHTSIVIAVHDNGDFETVYSKYVLVK